MLTIDYLVAEPENKIFDRKLARVKPSDLASFISAFETTLSFRASEASREMSNNRKI